MQPHTHRVSPITRVFSPTLFANQLFFKQCSERHYMPDCNWCLWWCQATASTAKRVAQGHRTSCEEKSSKQHVRPVSVVYQRKNQTRCLLRQQTLDAFHLQQECQSVEEMPCKHTPRSVDNVDQWNTNSLLGSDWPVSPTMVFIHRITRRESGFGALFHSRVKRITQFWEQSSCVYRSGKTILT